MRRITMRLLGPFEVTIDGVPVTTFALAKVRDQIMEQWRRKVLPLSR